MALFFRSNYKLQSKLRSYAAMESIAKDIESKIRNPTLIYTSLLFDGNTELIKCLVGTDDGCTAAELSPNPRKFFSLAQDLGGGELRLVTGLPGALIYYNTKGIQCTDPVGDPSCLFLAESFFYASCPDAAPSCVNGAETIHTAYRITLQQADAFQKEYGKGVPFLPAEIFYYTLKAADILGSFTDTSCNPGAVMKGYEKTGRPSCECSYPNVPRTIAPLTNRRGPLCRKTANAALVCPADRVFRGLKSDGSANCLTVDEAYDCIPIYPPNNGFEAECPVGYGWMQRTNKQYCFFQCNVRKDDGGSGGNCVSDEAADGRAQRTVGQRTVRGQLLYGSFGRRSGTGNPNMLGIEIPLDEYSINLGMAEYGPNRNGEFQPEGINCQINLSISCCRPK
ncbi:MAG: hypothetical protein KA436_09280 [Oligoflexales bacterium]|nr:hypothetical protein [Oligoflexales bacterium]